MKTLNVDLGERTYPIHIGHDLIDSDLLGSVIKGHQVLLVSNETVASVIPRPRVIQFNCF